ncbi:MAG: hypothetical protein AAF270_05015 [Pseudomonadota bacterium]
MEIDSAFDRQLIKEIVGLNQRFIEIIINANRLGEFAIDAGLVEKLAERLREASPSWPDCPMLLYRVVANDQGDTCAADTRLDHYDPSVTELITLSLGFLWQLARLDSRAAQLVAGVDAGWCEHLAALDVASLAGLPAHARLQPRLIDVPGFWQDLARRRGISFLQKNSLGAAGLQISLSRVRRGRVHTPVLPMAADAERQHR